MDRSDITIYFKKHHGSPVEIRNKANQVAAALLPPAHNGDPATAADLLAAIAEGKARVSLAEDQPIHYHQFNSMSFPQLIQVAATSLEKIDKELAGELRKRGAALLEAVS